MCQILESAGIPRKQKTACYYETTTGKATLTSWFGTIPVMKLCSDVENKCVAKLRSLNRTSAKEKQTEITKCAQKLKKPPIEMPQNSLTAPEKSPV